MSKMPVAAGDIREIAGQPVFVPLYKLFLAYGEMFVLAIGPKKFVVVSDNDVAREMLKDQATSFSKGLLSEILEFVMGTGLIPADGETWKSAKTHGRAVAAQEVRREHGRHVRRLRPERIRAARAVGDERRQRWRWRTFTRGSRSTSSARPCSTTTSTR